MRMRMRRRGGGGLPGGRLELRERSRKLNGFRLRSLWSAEVSKRRDTCALEKKTRTLRSSLWFLSFVFLLFFFSLKEKKNLNHCILVRIYVAHLSSFSFIPFSSVAIILEIFLLLSVCSLWDFCHYSYVCHLSLLHEGVAWLMTIHHDSDFQFWLMSYWKCRLLTLDSLWHFSAYSDLEFYYCFDLKFELGLLWHLGVDIWGVRLWGCEAFQNIYFFQVGYGFFFAHRLR